MPVCKALPEIINGFKIIQDLGMIVKEGCITRERRCIAICKKCNNKFETSIANLQIKIIGCSTACARYVGGNARLHKIFGMMKERCYNPKHKSFNNYGKKGIVICDIWLKKSSSFYLWAQRNGYSPELTLDRIDNEKGYYPSNCRWVDKSIQSQNSKQAKLDPNKIRLIRELCNMFEQRHVAKLFCVSLSLVNGIVKRTRWKNIKD